MEKRTDKKNLNFETALKELEDIALKLENGDLSLDDSIKAFEAGMQYAHFCHEKLEEAERTIEILQKGETKGVSKKQIKVKADTGEIEEDEELQGSLL